MPTKHKMTKEEESMLNEHLLENKIRTRVGEIKRTSKEEKKNEAKELRLFEVTKMT